ncbi:glutamate carboxypeptidase [Chlorella sorokiniana]|uniref:Glutamate carboxypeptidase n=1 Tax=Chlorella sorokiniana TaxID=3076 RepID=A0A2P6TM33_CHLSO|nr:glutamate carboxypeptidase [Chlorella sorokiniana]|eukprot:PRW45400.1 glutamate carboxypeptidase [Chlorella sorokiniana]
MAADWAGLHPPLLQSVLMHVMDHQVLQLPTYLAAGTAEAAAVRRQQAAIAAFALVCRQWRQAAAAALQQCAWAVAVQRAAGSAASALPSQLEPLAVASLDLRRLTWSESGGSSAAEALLLSRAFRSRSSGCLRCAVGIPERLCAELASGFPALDTVGLSEDYDSTDAHKHHSAPMQLAPLAALSQLRTLQLELGIVELAAVPPQVRQLQLTEIDRLVLPRVAGASIADRLLAAAATQGLDLIALEAASGCIVFEEANHAPMELELSHLARLLASSAGSSWRVQLSMRSDAALQQQRACLAVTSTGGGGGGKGE